MKKYIVIFLLIIFVIPSIAFASWWNPFSWNIFSFLHKKEVVPQVQVQVEVQKTSEEKISDLQKQLDDLKNQQPVSAPTTTTPVVKEVKKTIPVADNSAIIKAQIEATLKAKADQDALTAKQKADEQAKIDAELKIKAEQDAIIAKQKAEEQAKDDADLKAKLIQDELNKLSINDIVINTTFNSVKISWTTNIISESKVILNGHEYVSQGGIGTDHYVTINGLNSDLSYNGSVTAISNNAWQNKGFEFKTKTAPPAPPCPPTCSGSASA